MSKILNIILAIGLISLCVFLLLVESIELPSRAGAAPSIYQAPVTYLISVLPLAFGTSLILYEIDRVKYIKLIKIIVTTGIIVFFASLIIIAPLLKSL